MPLLGDAMAQLWFDVENVKNTTQEAIEKKEGQLWFDVENVKNTTRFIIPRGAHSCGLM